MVTAGTGQLWEADAQERPDTCLDLGLPPGQHPPLGLGPKLFMLT